MSFPLPPISRRSSRMDQKMICITKCSGSMVWGRRGQHRSPRALKSPGGYNPDNKNGSLKVTEPGHVLPLVEEIRGKKQEYFVCVTLNGAGEVLATRTVTVGLLNHSLVHPREVFADAITDRAASIICVHNHPSGSLEPSSQDIMITKQLIDSGTILGIRVLDHVIVTRQGYLSMRERGLI